MEKGTVGIRADGSAKIGMGHLMRCMSIALALQLKGERVVFITKDKQSNIFLTERGFNSVMFTKEYSFMEAEIQELCDILVKYNIYTLLVDSYEATPRYLEVLKNSVTVFYMDDIGRMDLPVNGLINYNIYGSELDYAHHYTKNCILLLGSIYAPVKKEFWQTRYVLSAEVRKIMITMGGSDSLNIAGNLAERLLEEIQDSVELIIICGRFSPHLEKIRMLANKYAQVTCFTDVPDMWNRMAECDLVISAAGSTMYELCTMGIPAICCYYVENQRQIAEGFAKKTSMVNAGNYAVEPEEVLHRIVTETKRLMHDTELRKRLAEEMHQISDGNGAERIAEKLIETKYHL